VTPLDQSGDGQPREGWLRPRRRSRAAAAHRLLSAWDTAVADYTRDAVTRTVRVANTTPSRADILRLRTDHYRETLADLGVPVWDDHDETAAHLLCTQDGQALGSLRIAPSHCGFGDLYEDFDHFDGLLAGREHFLLLAREVVRPQSRGTEVTTALLHSAGLWWRSHSPARRIMFTSIVRPGSAPSVFGATPITAPVPLGPAGVPVIVFAGDFDTMMGAAARRLERTRWTASRRLPG
jgi:predicted GNAT family N-acyltransferase